MNETLISILAEKNRAKKQLEQEIADIKATLEVDLPEEGFKNDLVTISRKSGSEKLVLDVEKFAEQEPTLYGELLADYGVVKKTKASVSYTFKKDKE